MTIPYTHDPVALKNRAKSVRDDWVHMLETRLMFLIPLKL